MIEDFRVAIRTIITDTQWLYKDHILPWSPVEPLRITFVTIVTDTQYSYRRCISLYSEHVYPYFHLYIGRWLPVEIGPSLRPLIVIYLGILAWYGYSVRKVLDLDSGFRIVPLEINAGKILTTASMYLNLFWWNLLDADLVALLMLALPAMISLLLPPSRKFLILWSSSRAPYLNWVTFLLIIANVLIFFESREAVFKSAIIRILSFGTLTAFALSGIEVGTKSFDLWKDKMLKDIGKIVRTLKSHILIIGYGDLGKSIVTEVMDTYEGQLRWRRVAGRDKVYWICKNLIVVDKREEIAPYSAGAFHPGGSLGYEVKNCKWMKRGVVWYKLSPLANEPPKGFRVKPRDELIPIFIGDASTPDTLRHVQAENADVILSACHDLATDSAVIQKANKRRAKVVVSCKSRRERDFLYQKFFQQDLLSYAAFHWVEFSGSLLAELLALGLKDPARSRKLIVGTYDAEYRLLYSMLYFWLNRFSREDADFLTPRKRSWFVRNMLIIDDAPPAGRTFTVTAPLWNRLVGIVHTADWAQKVYEGRFQIRRRSDIVEESICVPLIEGDVGRHLPEALKWRPEKILFLERKEGEMLKHLTQLLSYSHNLPRDYLKPQIVVVARSSEFKQEVLKHFGSSLNMIVGVCTPHRTAARELVKTAAYI